MAKKVRAVLVGCGGMSRRWTNVAKEHPELELVGFVDIHEEAAKARSVDYGDGVYVIGTDLAEVLKQTNPDAVFDCTIPEVHTSVALTAFEHDCHVLSEKPMADSMANAKKALEMAQQKDKIYAIIQNRRYDPNIRRLRRFLDAGHLGTLTTVNCDFYIGAHFGGFRDKMAHVLLLDMAIHTFDAARLITGADPVSVYCKEWNPPGSWYDQDASAIAIFEMDNGVVYTYRGSWCSEGLNTSWECDWRIIGDKGSLTWDGSDGFEVAVVSDTGEFRSKCEPRAVPDHDPSDRVGAHEGIIHEFVACVQQGGTPETTGSNNIRSLAMVFGAIESAERSLPVDISW
ncbi:MAG: putative dehydrogenase [Candidatus Latescibacterota bacterium]|jgi:predicted dehydrogenase